jgi:hypothetical protein
MLSPVVTSHVGVDHEITQHDKSNIDLMGSAYDIPAECETFDSAICNAVLEHLEEPEQAIRECYRVLKEGGIAIYTVTWTWSSCSTRREPRGMIVGGGETTSNAHFFNELARRVIQVSSQHGPLGRLLELDGNLRATSPHAPLAVSLEDMRQFFASGDAPLSQRQLLCKARAIYGTESACLQSEDIARQAVQSTPWSHESATQIFQQRMDLEQTASVHNIRRGPGGTVDVEVIAQMLQLKYAELPCHWLPLPGCYSVPSRPTSRPLRGARRSTSDFRYWISRISRSRDFMLLAKPAWGAWCSGAMAFTSPGQ